MRYLEATKNAEYRAAVEESRQIQIQKNTNTNADENRNTNENTMS